MEENYLDLEDMIENQFGFEDDPANEKLFGYQYDFNKEGINNMINVHDHID